MQKLYINLITIFFIILIDLDQSIHLIQAKCTNEIIIIRQGKEMSLQ